MLRHLEAIAVEKPWGRTDIPLDFGDFYGRRIGEIWFTRPDNPNALIMIKFLFTSERLSIQIHPGDDAAQAAGYPRGKDECWLVLDAGPDAELGVGLRAETTAETLRTAALDGSIVDMVDWRTARTDDFVYNRAGTIHAIGAGLIVVEVQQNVDCTYRLYDYGRPRDLHLDAGISVAETRPRPDPRDGRVAASQSRLLVDGPHFHLLHLAGPDVTADLPSDAEAYIFVPLSGGCSIEGEAVTLGECIATDRADTIALESGARALLCWPA